MDIEDKREYFLKYIQENFDKTLELRADFNKDTLDLKIKNIDQCRNFYNSITLISGGVFTIIVALGKPVYPLYVYVGAILYILLTILIMLYMREWLDKEGNQLKEQGDKYNDLLTEISEFYKGYLLLDSKEITQDVMTGHFKELHNLDGYKTFMGENRDNMEKRKKRINEGQNLINFIGEIIVSLFITATFFSLSSLYGKLSFATIILCLIFIILIGFSPSANFIINFLSKPASLVFNNKYFKKLSNKKIFEKNN